MSPFVSRERRSTRYLAWKIRIFAVAAVIAMTGMFLNNPYVTGAALVLLFIGMLLRFLPEPRPKQDPPPHDGPPGPP